MRSPKIPAVYSTDLRQRIVDAYQAQEGSQRELANRFRVSLSFVRDRHATLSAKR